MTIHAYVVNTLPQIRVCFPNGWTASVIVSGDGSVALAHWPTHDDSLIEANKFSREQVEARAREVVLHENQRAGPTELTLFLQTVEALPSLKLEKECSDGQETADAQGSAGQQVRIHEELREEDGEAFSSATELAKAARVSDAQLRRANRASGTTITPGGRRRAKKTS